MNRGVVILCLLVFSYSAIIRAEAPKAKPLSGLQDTSYLKAFVKEVDPLGRESLHPSTSLLTLHRNSQTLKPSTFTLTETVGSTPCKEGAGCAPMPVSMKVRTFRIAKVTATRCGSIHYIAEEVLPYLASVTILPQTWARLEVIDHHYRFCQEPKRHLWDVWLTNFPHPRKVDPARTQYLYGDPESAWNYDGCLHQASSGTCTMLYLPATCTAQTADGGKTRIHEITAYGSNSCHSILQIKTEACARGIQPSRLEENDIRCMTEADSDTRFGEQAHNQ